MTCEQNATPNEAKLSLDKKALTCQKQTSDLIYNKFTRYSIFVFNLHKPIRSDILKKIIYRVVIRAYYVVSIWNTFVLYIS